MTHNRSQLVGLVTDPLVMRDRDAAVLPDVLEPLLVGAVVREAIEVPFDGQSGGREDVGKAVAEIAVGEEDKPQAARSYSTASSISGGSRP